MKHDTSVDDKDILQKVIEALARLDSDSREKIVRTVVTFFEIDLGGQIQRTLPNATSTLTPSSQRAPQFGVHASQSPKEFLLEKAPQTDVDRAVCLAYYLAHYRETTHFRTADISKLNTEAAQRKFANAAWTVGQATQTGYFVPGAKDSKQLSSMGEHFVEALPDREAAKEVVAKMRPRRSRKRRDDNKPGV